MAQQLARTVKETTGSLAVGLIGPFGSGKSSVVRLLTTELAVNSDWAVLHVSAEHHSGVARARALMYALLEAAHQKKLIDDDTYARERSCLEGSRQRTLPRATHQGDTPGKPSRLRYLHAAGAGLGWVLAMLVVLWLLGVGAVAAVHLLGSGHHISAWTWFAPKGASALTGVLVSAAAIAAVLAAGKEGALQSLKAYEITVSSPRPESTDELEQAFVRLLRCIKRRLVIAVDDIDRLAASDVLEALATVRSFLLTGTQHRHQPVFVLSCDEDIVREAIVGVRPGLAHRPTTANSPGTAVDPSSDPEPGQSLRAVDDAARKATEDAAQEYLNKLFTIRLVLPAHYEADLRDYAEELLMGTAPHHPVVAEVGGPTQTRRLLEVLIHRRVRDPRHVIRLLNSFFSDYQLARRREQPVGTRPARIAPGEVTGFPIELARLTVLRHDFRNLYDAIQDENRLLHVLDEALLGSPEAHADPLLADYRAPGSPGRLDQEKYPGLAFLNATVARARTQRPVQIGPLITLGSSRASRLLGSQLAMEIESDLVQRNGAALAARLVEGENRTRIVEAATASLEAARPGQDLDNAVTAVLEALGQVSALLSADLPEGEEHAVHALTDCIVRQYERLTLPVPSHLLVPLLDLIIPAHLLRVRQALLPVPEDQGEAQTWAVALLSLPAGEDAAFLAPSLDSYFNGLAADGDRDELSYWEDQSQRLDTASWPATALAALLIIAARYDDAAAVRQVGSLINIRDDNRVWDGTVLPALLRILSATAAVRREAVRILCLAPDPSAGWGDGVEEGETLLATQIIQAVAQAVQDDDDADSMLIMMELLTRWLPAAQQLSDEQVAEEAIAGAAAVASAVHPNLTAAAGAILEQLHEEQAVPCAITMAAQLANHRDLGDDTGTVLRDILIGYLRRSENSAAEATHRAVTAVTAALTGEIEAATPAGRFARATLPMLLTTGPGIDMTTTLIQRVTGSLAPNNPAHAQEVLPSLRDLLRDPTAREGQLANVIRHVQQLMNSGTPSIALDFAAHYITTPVVDVNWLNWFASHWSTLSSGTRSLAVAAAERSELQSIPVLRDHLIQHLLETDDAEPWQYADALWNHSTADQQGSLLAFARTRCPALAHCADQADADLLTTALVQAGDQISGVLTLIQEAPEFDNAVMRYLSNRLEQPDWTPLLAASAIAVSGDPAALWMHVLPFMTEDQSSAIRAAAFIGALIEHHQDSVPEDIVTSLAPVLREADPQLATSLGHALRPLPARARKLRRAMDGFSSTPAQRARNAAFKEASGI
ncbi:P-loop NTPase fold protein [Streptomyces sp. ATCC51928]|uniref:P-loop NTPase fold protein n=1 Tax=Streptomyces caviscabies TaxID=90079 RepID=A0ABW2MNC3_9ACTN|nr:MULTISPECIES: P-loop NTPase fold protein [unclassified Streptomyces]MDX3341707.1 P-loop NTPase fold protein [Streptomyces sp. ME02-6979.5a]MDX3504521.1 P-loop NTPase fold protein [Streptomyces sp. ATCC51928]MDX5524195.1 P-loop NTPase fold protein [Streptomyces sp. DE06-01C]